jgi:hypothetical protein
LPSSVLVNLFFCYFDAGCRGKPCYARFVCVDTIKHRLLWANLNQKVSRISKPPSSTVKNLRRGAQNNLFIYLIGYGLLCGCETWSLTLRERRRLRVLRKIFGPKRDDVKGSGENS